MARIRRFIENDVLTEARLRPQPSDTQCRWCIAGTVRSHRPPSPPSTARPTEPLHSVRAHRYR